MCRSGRCRFRWRPFNGDGIPDIAAGGALGISWVPANTKSVVPLPLRSAATNCSEKLSAVCVDTWAKGAIAIAELDFDVPFLVGDEIGDSIAVRIRHLDPIAM